MTEMNLVESYDGGFPFSESTVDRESGVISNVSFLGRVSKNGRIYSTTAMQEAAKLHKGAGVYLDHPTEKEEREREGVRSVRDLAGHAINARVVADRVRGDVRALKGTPTGEFLLAVAEQAPSAVGISHRARGASKVGEDGVEHVEHVTAVGGLDLVTEPATVAGLFESIHERYGGDMPNLKEALQHEIAKQQDWMVEWTLRGSPPDEVTGVRKLLEAALDGDKETALDVLGEVREDLRRLSKLGGRKRRKRGGPPISIERDPDITPEDLARAADTFNYGESSSKPITPEELEEARKMFYGPVPEPRITDEDMGRAFDLF